MRNEVETHIHAAKSKMEKAIAHLEAELSKVRAGKANPSMLEGVQVDYYGTKTPITQVANVTTTDAKTIVIQPWEKQMLQEIEKAIQAANLGINPQNDGNVIRLILPPLTEERRKDLVKQIRELAEDCRISIRSARRESIDKIKKLTNEGLAEDEAKDAEQKVQDETNGYNSLVDKHLEAKEKDIMTI